MAYQHCNVLEETQIEALMAAAVARFGGLDIVFNNAGAGGTPAPIAEMTGEGWDRTQALLLRSVALGIRYAVPHMKARGGAIVNTASIAVGIGRGGHAYSVQGRLDHSPASPGRIARSKSASTRCARA